MCPQYIKFYTVFKNMGDHSQNNRFDRYIFKYFISLIEDGSVKTHNYTLLVVLNNFSVAISGTLDL